MKQWMLFCLTCFGLGCVVGLAVLDLQGPQPAPRPFPPGYGRSPVQYFEPTTANEYRYDI